MTPRVDVLTFGEAMMSLRSQGPLRLGRDLTASVAGAESNVAICLARLGHEVRWVGRVGDDEPGALVLRTLRAEGVDVSGVQVDGTAQTGLILFDRPTPSTRSVMYYRTGSAGSRLTAEHVLASLDDGCRILHVTGVTCALSESAAAAVRAAAVKARELGAVVCLDVNYRASLWDSATAASTLAPLALMSDIVIGSPDELALLASSGDGAVDTSAAAARLLDRGVDQVVTKLGSEGARVDTSAGARQVAAHQVSVVDPVGAGDAFCSGYLSALLDGADLDERLRRGNLLGAAVVGSEGDWEEAPRRKDLDLLGRPGTVLR